MRLAPLIHTRTFNCDFSSEFLVRPVDFLDKDIKWARKAVLDATAAIDKLQGERWLVFDNGSYRVAGVVGFTKNICQKAGMLEDDESRKLFTDNKGRIIYAFIGIVTKCSDCFHDEELSYDYLWNEYKQCVAGVWEHTYQSVILKDFKDVSLPKRREIKNTAYTAINIGTIQCYESNDNLDDEVFEKYLLSKRNNFSFCSNLCDMIAVKNSSFSIITTTNNIITRMKREATAQSVPQQEHLPENPNPEPENEKKNSIRNKNYLPILCIGILISVLAIVAVSRIALK